MPVLVCHDSAFVQLLDGGISGLGLEPERLLKRCQQDVALERILSALLSGWFAEDSLFALHFLVVTLHNYRVVEDVKVFTMLLPSNYMKPTFFASTRRKYGTVSYSKTFKNIIFETLTDISTAFHIC